MSELGDKLAAIRQRAIDSGELSGEDMLAADEIRPYREGWLAEWRELVVLRADRDRPAAECELLKHAITDNIFLKQQVTNLLIERDRLAAELAAERAKCAAMRLEMNGRSFAQQEAEALRAELSAARADAERYRWLRDAKLNRDNVVPLVDLWLFSRPTASAKAIDSAIDEDRAASSAGGDHGN